MFHCPLLITQPLAVVLHGVAVVFMCSKTGAFRDHPFTVAVTVLNRSSISEKHWKFSFCVYTA